jgi:hypothetical protein
VARSIYPGGKSPQALKDRRRPRLRRTEFLGPTRFEPRGCRVRRLREPARARIRDATSLSQSAVSAATSRTSRGTPRASSRSCTRSAARRRRRSSSQSRTSAAETGRAASCSPSSGPQTSDRQRRKHHLATGSTPGSAAAGVVLAVQRRSSCNMRPRSPRQRLPRTPGRKASIIVPHRTRCSSSASNSLPPSSTASNVSCNSSLVRQPWSCRGAGGLCADEDGLVGLDREADLPALSVDDVVEVAEVVRGQVEYLFLRVCEPGQESR